MSNSSGRTLFSTLAALLGAAGSFVLTTVMMDTIADTVIVGLSTVTALIFVAALQGTAGITELRNTDRRTLGIAAAGGALAFWAAPLLTLSQRASDAPSGADVLFFTTAVWGLACVALAFALRAERPPVTALAGAVAAVAGAAGLLASWENPSSFSPFGKFPVREALMIVAGLLFAAGALALAEAARRSGPRIALAAGLSGASALGLLVAVPSLPSAIEIGRGALFSCIYLGIAVALFALGWTHASASAGVSRASVAFLGVPVVITSLTVVERFTSMYGPDPVEWPGAIAGIAVIVAGALVVWLAQTPAPQPSGLRRPLWVPLGMAVTSGVLALASLATPALNAISEGGTGIPFRAEWIMVGAESATGWLAVAAAGLALAAVMVARRGGDARSWAPSAVAVAACNLAAIPLVGATLHTWNRWVPADVQQAYGTEYSRLLIEPRLDTVRVAAMLFSVAAVVALAFAARRVPATRGVDGEDAL